MCAVRDADAWPEDCLLLPSELNVLITAGWCVWFFTVLAGAVLLILNTKLVHILRYVTRGGHVHRLKPGIFWLNRCCPCPCPCPGRPPAQSCPC